MEYEKPLSGTLRISNPKTLEKWIHNGKFKALLDKGYTFFPDCFRFRTIKCTCYRCRKPNGSLKGNELRKVINKHFKN